MTELSGWEHFYSVVGSSAGALIGLQFVVLTLIAHLPAGDVDGQTGNAFTTPTMVHFGVVLLLSAVASAPWHAISPFADVCGVTGFLGVGYTIVTARRLGSQTAYHPVFEDRLFHIVLPLAAYGVLLGSAFAADLYPRPALFAVGGASLLLLFIGIHNAWDTVTFHVFVKRQSDKNRDDRPAQDRPE
jgi:hypothetical protein